MMDGRVVLITGSGKGIGRYMAGSFARNGARVVVNDIAPLDNVTREVKAADAEVLAIQADVRDEAQVRAMIDRTVAHFGRLDVLVNNAAIVTHFQWGITPWPRIRDLDKSFWDKVIETNLTGTFLCSKYALPHLEAQRSGHIISTMGGSSPGSIGASPYPVTKDALRTFTRFLAEEEREFDVCVVMMRPGAQIATEEAPEEARRRMPGPDIIGDRFVIAATAGMDLSGNLLDVKDGELVIDDRG